MSEPRDHIIPLSAQLRSDMTTLANVSVKVSVNGGAATTYNSGSTPAVTQDADITYAYKVNIPASTYTDGDVVAVKWLYSSTGYAYESILIGPNAVDGSAYTTTRGAKLDNLDATVSSRSTYAGADTAGTTTLLSRLTSTRAGYLDNLTNLDAAISSIAASVWGYVTRTLTAASDSSGVTTLLSRLTSGRATNLDNLDAAVSSRAAASDYTSARAAKLDLIGTASATISSPITSTGSIIILQGDDYLDADGRSITWTGTNWPSLTSATISFQLHGGVFTKAGTVLSSTQAQVEFNRTDFTAVEPGVYSYALIATLSNTHVVTLTTGSMVLEGSP